MNGTGFPLTALLHGEAPFKKIKKEKTANPSTPGQVLNQLCRKAAVWIQIRTSTGLQALYLYKTLSILPQQIHGIVANLSIISHWFSFLF